MAKFVAVNKHGSWRVVFRTVIGEGFPPEPVIERIKALKDCYNELEARQEAEKLNREFYPMYLVSPFAQYGTDAQRYLAVRVRRNKDGQAIGRELCLKVFESEAAAQDALLNSSLSWVKDCQANRQPVACVNGVRILNNFKQGGKLLFLYRGLLPNGRLMDFDVRRLAAAIRRNVVVDYGTLDDQRAEIDRLWESIWPSFDLAGWIEQNGYETYTMLDR